MLEALEEPLGGAVELSAVVEEVEVGLLSDEEVGVGVKEVDEEVLCVCLEEVGLVFGGGCEVLVLVGIELVGLGVVDGPPSVVCGLLEVPDDAACLASERASKKFDKEVTGLTGSC